MLKVTLFSRNECHLCEVVEEELDSLQRKYPHQLTTIDLDQNPEFQAAYGNEIPVIQIGSSFLKAPIELTKIEETLSIAFNQLKKFKNSENQYGPKK